MLLTTEQVKRFAHGYLTPTCSLTIFTHPIRALQPLHKT